MMRKTFVVLAALAWAGCFPDHGKAPPQGEPAKALDAALGAKPPKVTLPEPTPAPPRPEGEPKTAKDFLALSGAAQAGTPVDKPGAPPIQRLDAFRFRVGKVFVDRQARVVQIPGRVNMIEGILEYYAVSSNGKLHESVLEVFAEPSHIHLGLILLGLETAEFQRDPKGLKPSFLTRNGGTMRLFVEYQDPKTNQLTRVAAEQWLFNRQTQKAAEPELWMFRGSSFWNNQYSADLNRSIIGLVPDETVVLDSTVDIGNPYRGGDLGFECNKALMPPVGTPITLILEAVDNGGSMAPPPPPPPAAPEGAEPVDAAPPPPPPPPTPPNPALPPRPEAPPGPM